MLRRSLVALSLVLVACTDPDAPKPLRAGAAWRFFDVPIGHSHGGFAQSTYIGEEHPDDDPKSPYADLFPATRGQQSPPGAKALVLDDGRRRLALVRIDAIFVTEALSARVLTRAQEKLGEDLGNGRLILNATHTHSAPARLSDHSSVTTIADIAPEYPETLWHGIDSYSQETVDRMAEAIVDAIGEARDRLAPATFGWGTGVNHATQEDRRCTNDYYLGANDQDPTVTVLRVDDAASGKPIAVLFHQPFHGTVFKQTSRSFNVDGPGGVEYAVEDAFDSPVVAMYLQGAAGGVGPMGGQAGHRGSQQVERLGRDLAATILDVYGRIATQDTVKIDTNDRLVPLTWETLGYPDDESFPQDGATLCQQLVIDECRTEIVEKRNVNCLASALPGKGKYSTRVSVAQLGDFALMTLPGEPVPQVGRELERLATELGPKKALVLGYAQDHNGYILLEQDWLSGGYEPTISFWGWRFGDFIVAQSVDVLAELRTGKAARKLPVTIPPDLAPKTYVPVAARDSTIGADVIADVPATLERLDQLELRFHGGDAALGLPRVQLEVAAGDAFSPVLRRGWKPVTNHDGDLLPTFYEESPTYAAAPEATAREHRWRVVFEAPVDFPAARYRLRVTGRQQRNGTVAPYELTSAAFEVVPSTKLRVEAARNGATIAMTLVYPDHAPRWAGGDNGGWQLGGFHLVDARFHPDWTPVTDGASADEITLRSGDATTAIRPESLTIPLTGTELERYAPGAGPGFTVTAAASGTVQLEVPAGALRDRFGNGNAAATHAL